MIPLPWSEPNWQHAQHRFDNLRAGSGCPSKAQNAISVGKTGSGGSWQATCLPNNFEFLICRATIPRCRFLLGGEIGRSGRHAPLREVHV